MQCKGGNNKIACDKLNVYLHTIGTLMNDGKVEWLTFNHKILEKFMNYV
jgi:hypothetical protein